jgi:serine/threonine-protein kinase
MSNVSWRLSAAPGRSYRLERELGAAGWATVCLAANLKHDHKVARKVLKPELAGERFVAPRGRWQWGSGGVVLRC